MNLVTGDSSRSLPADTYRLWVGCRDKVFSALVRRSFHSFGAGSIIKLPVRLDGERRIHIGSGVHVGADSWLQTLRPTGDGPEPLLEIGDGTSIAGHCTISAGLRVRVGESVLMARNVYIADHSHAFRDPFRPIIEQGVERLEAVSIDEGSWLGQNVFVGPGVHIGRGAVVGANAVVLSDLPDHAIAVGAPARVVRFTTDVDAGDAAGPSAASH